LGEAAPAEDTKLAATLSLDFFFHGQLRREEEEPSFSFSISTQIYLPFSNPLESSSQILLSNPLSTPPPTCCNVEIDDHRLLRDPQHKMKSFCAIALTLLSKLESKSENPQYLRLLRSRNYAIYIGEQETNIQSGCLLL
jgi:hypothetical protein